jgi:hypothetical protein
MATITALVVTQRDLRRDTGDAAAAFHALLALPASTCSWLRFFPDINRELQPFWRHVAHVVSRQDDAAGLFGHIGAGADGDADVGLVLQGGSSAKLTLASGPGCILTCVNAGNSCVQSIQGAAWQFAIPTNKGDIMSARARPFVASFVLWLVMVRPTYIPVALS